MHSQVLPQNAATSYDRRHHARHHLKALSTVVVELGPNNGGNLIDIGAGGLSLQAVAKLIPGMDLSLRFRLDGVVQPIEIVGRVAWVGPTQKVAGISFTNLRHDTEQQIVEWVAARQDPVQPVPSSQSNQVQPLPLPLPISLQPISATEPDPVPPPSLPISHDGTTKTEPDASPPPLSPSSISVHRIMPREKLVLLLDTSPESVTENSKPPLETFTLSKNAAAFSSPRSISLDPSLISPAHITAPDDRMSEPSSSESGWRYLKLALVVAAGIIGILALFAMASNLGGLFGHHV